MKWLFTCLLAVMLLPGVHAHASEGFPDEHDLLNNTDNGTVPETCNPADPIDKTYVYVTTGLLVSGLVLLGLGFFVRGKKKRTVRYALLSIGVLALIASAVVAGMKLEINADTIRFGSPGGAHEHADFQVMIHDQLIDFTNDYYLSYKGHDRSRYVHLHDPDYVLHKHATGVTWAYFFRTLNVTMDDTCIDVRGTPICGATFIVNDMPLETLDTEIHDGDRALFHYGIGNASLYFPLAVGNNSCIHSGTCPERGIASGCSSAP